MKKISIVIGIIAVLSISSCKSNKDANKSSEPINTEAAKSGSGNADLILSFFSPGNGIDREKFNEVKSFLETEHPSVTYQSVSWGKEGERDLCFDLSGMSADDKQALTNKLKEMVSSSNRVRVKENEPCREAK